MKSIGIGEVILENHPVKLFTTKTDPFKVEIKCVTEDIKVDYSSKVLGKNKTNKTIICEFTCFLDRSFIEIFPIMCFQDKITFVNKGGLKLTIHRASINLNYILNYKASQMHKLRFYCVGLYNNGDNIYDIE